MQHNPVVEKPNQCILASAKSRNLDSKQHSAKEQAPSLENEVRNPNQPRQYQAQRTTLTFQGKMSARAKAESRNDLTRAEGHSALCMQS